MPQLYVAFQNISPITNTNSIKTGEIYFTENSQNFASPVASLLSKNSCLMFFIPILNTANKQISMLVSGSKILFVILSNKSDRKSVV